MGMSTRPSLYGENIKETRRTGDHHIASLSWRAIGKNYSIPTNQYEANNIANFLLDNYPNLYFSKCSKNGTAKIEFCACICKTAEGYYGEMCDKKCDLEIQKINKDQTDCEDIVMTTVTPAEETLTSVEPKTPKPRTEEVDGPVDDRNGTAQIEVEESGFDIKVVLPCIVGTIIGVIVIVCI